MASDDDYAAWIVKNADKKGTPEFETVAQAYRDARGQSAPKPAAEQETAYDPSAGGGTLQFGPWDTGIKTPQWLDRGLAGMGKAFADAGTGIAQFADAPLDLISPREKTLSGMVTGQQPLSRVEERRRQIEEQRKLDAPLMNTTAGTIGNIAGNVALTAGIPGATGVKGAAMAGVALGLAQPSTSLGDTAANVGFGAAGGAGGKAVANLIGGVASTSGNLITQGQRQAMTAGERQGMRITPGKASGSRVLQRLEAAAESNPLSGGAFDALKQGNQRALNRAAAKSIGETADEVSGPVLARAQDRLGQVFDSVADSTPVALDPQKVGGRLRQVIQDSDGLIGGNGKLDDNALIKRLDEFVNTHGGATREQLRALSSKIGKAARNAMTSPVGDRELGSALFAAQEIVDDSIEGTLSQAQKATFNEARGQYRNLMHLLSGQAINETSGNVNARSLASVLKSKDRSGFTMGRNQSDLYDATRFVRAFPEIVGDSGTATRNAGITDMALGLPGNLLGRAYLTKPVVSAARAGAGASGIAASLARQPANLIGAPLGTAVGVAVPNWVQQ